MKVKIGAFLGGVLFGVGLAIAGMTQPAKIVGFFDFFGSWDPSLAFVMVGAIVVYTAFSLPTRKDIDGRLILGSAIFGVGWGLGGYCPGPAFTSVGARSEEAFTFGLAMLIGVGAYQLFMRMRQNRSGGTVDPEAAAMIDG